MRFFIIIKSLVLFGLRKTISIPLRVLFSSRTFKKNGVGFIHIPKAAGVSVWQDVYKVEPVGHISYSEYKIFKDLIGIEWFTIVRHPIKRFESAYNYLQQGGRGTDYDYGVRELLKTYNNIDDFIEAFLSDVELQNIEHFRPMCYWLDDIPENLLVFKIEELEELNKWLQQRFNCRLLNRRNEMKIKAERMSRESQIKLVKYYSVDFLRFNYNELG